MQTELHRHLDASLRLSTLLELAQARGLEPQSTSLDHFREKFILNTPQFNLDTVLSKFNLFQQVLDSPEVLERVAEEAVQDCYQEGTRQVEFRFSPSFVCELNPHLSWKDVLFSFDNGIQKALKKFPQMHAGLICIASRNYGVERVEETIDFFLKYRKHFIGFDLAGTEKGFPCRLFEKSFQKLRETQLNHPITIHAGEDSGAENIWEALEYLGARRIGHGIRYSEDPLLARHLAEKKICLEMCPTSNWITGCVRDLRSHPLLTAIRSGISVCINTDDPGIFGNSMTYETNLCMHVIGLTAADLKLCNQNAMQASFL